MADRRLPDGKKITMRSLSLALGYSDNTVHKWYRENRWPDRDEERIAKLCGVAPEFFEMVRGMPYEQALAETKEKAPLPPEDQQAHENLNVALRERGQFVREHILRQLQMLKIGRFPTVGESPTEESKK